MRRYPAVAQEQNSIEASIVSGNTLAIRTVPHLNLHERRDDGLVGPPPERPAAPLPDSTYRCTVDLSIRSGPTGTQSSQPSHSAGLANEQVSHADRQFWAETASPRARAERHFEGRLAPRWVVTECGRWAPATLCDQRGDEMPDPGRRLVCNIALGGE